MDQNIKQFQESITEELDIIKDRVRNLIAAANWGEEGRYKEAILKNVIRKFLPSNLSLGTGFVIKKNDSENAISKQIDLIIYDNSIPVLFKEGDFIITTPQNVRGIIEVKTKITGSDFQEIINKAEENGRIIGRDIFNGVFSYEFTGDINSDSIKDTLSSINGFINHISLGTQHFIRLWKADDAPNLSVPVDSENKGKDFYNIYNLSNLAFSYFISNLIEISCTSKLEDRYWFLYPIEGTKETQRTDTIFITNRNP